MRLEEIRIQNYRSIDDVTLRFPPNKPVILFGPNNAGKSNIWSAILNLRRFDPRYAVEPKWRPIANGASVYDTLSSNGMLMMQHHLDSLTKKFTNSGAPSRGCDSATEITLTVDLRDRKEQIKVGFSKCRSDDYLPYVKNKRVLLNLPLPADREIPFIQVWESGSGDPSYYLDYLKIVRGEEGNRSPEWFLKLIPEIDKRVSDSIKEINGFDELSQGRGDALPASTFFVGSGQQAWVGRFGDLAAASVIKSAVDDLQLVLMDEPETHLHPNVGAQLWEKIQTASENGVQVILTTHSENFLKADNLEGFVRVYKENGATKTCQLTKKRLFLTCNPTLDHYEEESFVEVFWSVRLNSDQLKGFFANIILLVEGPTEYYALPVYLSRKFLSQYGIQIVPCSGKIAILTYWRLFEAYGYKCFILHDYDDQRDDWNKKLEKYFYGEKEEGEHYCISETAAYFQNNWEDYFEFGIDEEKYQKIKHDLEGKIKFPPRKEEKEKKEYFDPKELCAKAIALKMVKKVASIPFIEALKSNLRKLGSMSQEEYAKYVKTVQEGLKSEQNKAR